MTQESMIKMFNASLKDRNLDGEYLMLIRSDNPGNIFNESIPNMIDQVMKFDKKGIGETVSSVLFAKEIAEKSYLMSAMPAYKMSLWTLHNSLLQTKLPVRTNLLKMEEEGDKEALIKRCIRGIRDLNDVVTYSATTHYLKLCKTKAEILDYLIKVNEGFFDFGGILLAQLGVIAKYISNNDNIENINKFVASITKRYAFINRIDTQPQLQEIKASLKNPVMEIIKKESNKKILSREEIHGAADGFLMLKCDEVSELIEELKSRNIGREEFMNILWLASLKRAILFDHNNRDFHANKRLGWILSISGIVYLHGIKLITEATDKMKIDISDNTLSNWIINCIWLILDSNKVSLQGDKLTKRLNVVNPLNIKENDEFSYEKMIEYSTHLYSDESVREVFGFVYKNPESSFEAVCQMINYLFECDNNDMVVESAFLNLSSALLDILKSDFATMLGSYSSALIALTLSNKTIFNFGQGHSRFELVEETAKMFKKG